MVLAHRVCLLVRHQVALECKLQTALALYGLAAQLLMVAHINLNHVIAHHQKQKFLHTIIVLKKD